MKIYSNGKNRVLTGNFPARFRLLNGGVDVPFIRTGQNSIRLSGEVPFGDLDILEVIKEKVQQRPSLMADARFVMVNSNEADRLEKLGQTLDEKSKLLEEKSKELEQKGKEIIEWESETQKKIDQTNENLSKVAKVVSDEIESDREKLKKTIKTLSDEISETSKILVQSIDEHKKTKNPHKISKEEIGLGNVDNTSDSDKPISKATQKALDKKADKKDLEDLDKKLSESGKKQDSIIKSIENANLYGGVGGNELPNGGKTGQVLTKKSSKTGDYEWDDASPSVEILRVEELPSTGKTNTLYLVPVDDPETDNIYDEYIWALQEDESYAWEKIGSTEIDLSGYVPTSRTINSKALTEDISLNSDDVGAESKATIQTLSATDSITLADNTIYNGGEQTALTIALPATVDVSFLCEIDFTSGATATTLSYPNTIKWAGDDVANNVFIPVASKRYTIICAYDGVNYRATVKGVA